MPAVSDDVQQTQADKVEASQTPSLKSLAVFFAPLSPMNPVPRMWLFGYGPAVISYLLYFGQGAPPPFVLRYALLGAASGAALDERPAWMAALDCGERVVLLAVHLFLVLFHLGAATFFKSEAGAAMLAEARDLAFTDAPRGAAAYDAIQWPPSMFVAKPVLYMRLLLCVEVLTAGTEHAKLAHTPSTRPTATEAISADAPIARADGVCRRSGRVARRSCHRFFSWRSASPTSR